MDTKTESKSSKCQLCNTDTDLGDTYKFFFGKALSSRRVGNEVHTTYQIAGSREAFFCDKCLAEKLIPKSLGSTILGSFFLAILLGILPLSFLWLQVFFVSTANPHSAPPPLTQTVRRSFSSTSDYAAHREVAGYGP